MEVTFVLKHLVGLKTDLKDFLSRVHTDADEHCSCMSKMAWPDREATNTQANLSAFML